MDTENPLVTVRRILISGIRGYKAKVKRREQVGIPLYRTASESGNSRNRKKVMGRSTWFKGGGGGKIRTLELIMGTERRGAIKLKRATLEPVLHKPEQYFL